MQLTGVILSRLLPCFNDSLKRKGRHDDMHDRLLFFLQDLFVVECWLAFKKDVLDRVQNLGPSKSPALLVISTFRGSLVYW